MESCYELFTKITNNQEKMSYGSAKTIVTSQNNSVKMSKKEIYTKQITLMLVVVSKQKKPLIGNVITLISHNY